MGLEAPIQVCSGLQQVYTLEQMQNILCVVVYNLKAAKLGGVLSQGMVLCAKSEGQVEFLTPPEGAVPGERVTIAGVEGEPLSAAQVSKRKVWEQVSVDLKSNTELQGTYQGSPLQTSAGPCIVKSLQNALIS